MTHRFTPLALAATLAVLAAPASAVSVIRNLANFDAVNNTGHHADGFEIELEDPDLWDDSSNAGQHNSSKYVYSVFGLDRNFGPLGFQVTRFSQAAVTNYNNAANQHAGVRITYGFAGGTLLTASQIDEAAANQATTPFNPGGFTTQGESCWPGNVTWSKANPCDHFGVATTGNVLSTRYSWVVQAEAGKPLVSELVAIPAVVYQAPAPAPGQAAQPVVARIEAVEMEPDRIDRNWGTAVWVKTFTTITKNHDIEWKLLQNRPKSQDDEEPDGEDADEAQEDALTLDDNSKSFIRRYEFFEYTGGYDADKKNRAFCDNDSDSLKDPMAFGAVGNFLGRQIAGYNALEAAAPVPEPQTWAMFAAGLLAQVGLRRRSRQA